MNILAEANDYEATEAGAISDGFLSATLSNIGKATALVNGVALSSGSTRDYPFVGKGYKGIAYDPKASKLSIKAIY